MSDLRDDLETEFIFHIPADLWRKGMAACRRLGLQPGAKRTAEESMALLLLHLLNEVDL